MVAWTHARQGAAGVAAVLSGKIGNVVDKHVVCILSGRTITAPDLAALIA